MRGFTVSVVVAALVWIACDEAAGPLEGGGARNEPPTIASYAPSDTAVEAFVGETVRFSLRATDPEDDELSFKFFLDDSLVSTASEWSYTVDAEGPCYVWGLVGDAAHELWVTWRLTRFVAEGDPINIVTFAATPVPGLSIVSWIAARDTRGNPLKRYWVATALAPITTEYAWSVAHVYEAVEDPHEPGTTVSMLIDDLTALQTHYVAVRGVDDRGHFTRLGASPALAVPGMLLTGTVRAIPGGTPAAGVTVRLSQYEAVTGTDGRFVMAGLPSITASVVASDDDGAPGVGAFYDYAVLHTTSWVDSVDLYLLLDQPLAPGAYYPDFLVMYRTLTTVSGIPVPSSTRRWTPPIALYAPPFVYQGLDYAATVKQTALEINATTGLTLFKLVDEPPAEGVIVVYSNQATVDRYIVRERWPDWYPRLGEITFRIRYQAGDLVEFRRVARHELGHAVGLNHSADPRHLMYPQFPTQDDFNAEEVAVIRTLYAMPRGLNVSGFLDD